jgi:hypothetical protein
LRWSRAAANRSASDIAAITPRPSTATVRLRARLTIATTSGRLGANEQVARVDLQAIADVGEDLAADDCVEDVAADIHAASQPKTGDLWHRKHLAMGENVDGAHSGVDRTGDALWFRAKAGAHVPVDAAAHNGR